MVKYLPARLLMTMLMTTLFMSGCSTSMYGPPWGRSGNSGPVIVEDRGATAPAPKPSAGRSQGQRSSPVITPEQVNRPPEDKPQSPAVLALLEQADTLQRQGDLDGAATQVERALRIEPRNGRAYLQLATLRFQQNKVMQAEQLALKGLAYPVSANLQADLWELIARCRESRGDQAGAREAQIKVEELRSGRYS